MTSPAPPKPGDIIPAWAKLIEIVHESRPGWPLADIEKAVTAVMVVGMPWERAFTRLAAIAIRPDGHPSELADEVRGLPAVAVPGRRPPRLALPAAPPGPGPAGSEP